MEVIDPQLLTLRPDTSSRRPAAKMRGACSCAGSSHPHLVEAICERPGQKPSKVDLKKFANGETSVEISTHPPNTRRQRARNTDSSGRDVGP